MSIILGLAMFTALFIGLLWGVIAASTESARRNQRKHSRKRALSSSRLPALPPVLQKTCENCGAPYQGQEICYYCDSKTWKTNPHPS